ncbi:replication initiator protein [Capybara microvirus Cap1_SP_163]|nr:replication initiator protein [Capybara microvirus Cap1_SP_163]
MKCINPTYAYLVGSAPALDGIISPRITFDHREAENYVMRHFPVQFSSNGSLAPWTIAFPCGRCYNCLTKKKKDMSVRLMHEASQHSECCFITLTYDNEHLPSVMCEDGVVRATLVKKHLSAFLKRLRRSLEYHHLGGRFRFFGVGEYGSKSYRPHYHLLIFGWSPRDVVPLFVRNGKQISRSLIIEKNWKYGFSTVSGFSPAVARYCARYCVKKMDDGIAFDALCPVFTIASNRSGGIGASWFDAYGVESCRRGYCTARLGSDRIAKYAIPEYYYRRLRRIDPVAFCEVRDARRQWLLDNPTDDPYLEHLDHLRYMECRQYEDRRLSDFESI